MIETVYRLSHDVYTPDEREYHTLFYERAHDEIRSWDFDTPLGYRCDIVAATSPLKPWDQNLQLARDVLTELEAGRDGTAVKGLMGSRRKAATIAYHGGGPGGGLKVRCFAYNLRLNDMYVTVDRHMLAMLGYGDRPTKTKIREAAKTIFDFADTMNYKPMHMQALLWATWRKLKGLEDYK